MSNKIHEENQPEETVDERIVFLIEAFQEVSEDVEEYSYNEEKKQYEIKAKDVLIILKASDTRVGYVKAFVCLDDSDELIFVEEILLSKICNSNCVQLWTNLNVEYLESVKNKRETIASGLLRHIGFKIFEARGEKERYGQCYFNVERLYRKISKELGMEYKRRG